MFCTITSGLVRLLFLIAALLTQRLPATIYELPSVSHLAQYVDEDTLVLFDLDHTLFEATTAWGHGATFHHAIEKGKQEGLDVLTAVESVYGRWADAQKACRVKPVEAITPEVIRTLQDQSIKVIGLTHRQIRVSIASLDQLASIGVDFDRTAIHHEQVDLDGFVAPVRYLEGVLFVADYNDKGEVLAAFLNKIGYRPKKVVFIDDAMRNLVSVEKALAPLGVAVTGLHYRLIENTLHLWNPIVAELQAKLYGTILSDEAAHCLLQAK